MKVKPELKRREVVMVGVEESQTAVACLFETETDIRSNASIL